MNEFNTNASEVNSPAGTAAAHNDGEAVAATAPALAGSLTGWQKFVLIFKVVEVRLRFIAILVAVAFFVGYWDTIKNHWEKQTRPDGGIYKSVRAVLGERTAHWLWPQGAAGAAPDSKTEFYCPMHPNVVRPGLDPNGAIPKCPICGMPLSLRKKGAAPKLPEGVLSRKQLSPEQIQLAGVKTVEIAYQPLVKELTTVGYVGYDESQRSRIVSRVSGYLEKLYVDKPWMTVNEGDPLGEIYSPELYSAARELLLSLERKGTEGLAQSSRERLRLFGIEDKEIDEIVQSHRANHRLVLRAPRTGHVIRKDVVQGAHVEAGQTLFEIANLSKVWIEAEVFQADIEFLHEGQAVEATVEGRHNPFVGKVSLVHPHLDATTRTNAVRFEVDNPGHKLRPGMFATMRIKTPLSEVEPFNTLAEASLGSTSIRSAEPREYFTCPTHADVMMDKPGECPKCMKELESRPLNEDQRLIWWCPMHPKVTADHAGEQCDDCGGMKLLPKLTLLAKEGEVLAVPERSVIDTGSKKIVYVEREPGTFEGVAVELGPRAGGFYPVVKGLQPGDRIAAAGSFLIDAETRLNPAAAATYIGAGGGPSTAKSTTAAPGATVADAETRLNSAESPKKLSAEELKSIDKLAPADRELALAQRLCPVSGEPLGSMGVPHKMTIKGQTVFLCCKGCNSEVNKEPDKFLKKVAELKGGKE